MARKHRGLIGLLAAMLVSSMVGVCDAKAEPSGLTISAIEVSGQRIRATISGCSRVEGASKIHAQLFDIEGVSLRADKKFAFDPPAAGAAVIEMPDYAAGLKSLQIICAQSSSQQAAISYLEKPGQIVAKQQSWAVNEAVDLFVAASSVKVDPNGRFSGGMLSFKMTNPAGDQHDIFYPQGRPIYRADSDLGFLDGLPGGAGWVKARVGIPDHGPGRYVLEVRSSVVESYSYAVFDRDWQGRLHLTQTDAKPFASPLRIDLRAGNTPGESRWQISGCPAGTVKLYHTVGADTAAGEMLEVPLTAGGTVELSGPNGGLWQEAWFACMDNIDRALAVFGGESSRPFLNQNPLMRVAKSAAGDEVSFDHRGLTGQSLGDLADTELYATSPAGEVLALGKFGPRNVWRGRLPRALAGEYRLHTQPRPVRYGGDGFLAMPVQWRGSYIVQPGEVSDLPPMQTKIVEGGAIGAYAQANRAAFGRAINNEVTTNGVTYQDFEGGRIFWTPAGGIKPLSGGFYLNHQSKPWLGLPLTAELTRGGATYQLFENGVLTWRPGQGVFASQGAIHAAWLNAGGASGSFGLPTSNEVALGGGKVVQHFDGGDAYWAPGAGAWFVHRGNKAEWERLGGVNGPLGAPTGNEVALGGGVVVQTFQHGRIYWSPRFGARAVHGGILDRYLASGGHAVLGVPRSGEYAYRRGVRQDFANAAIVWP